MGYWSRSARFKHNSESRRNNKWKQRSRFRRRTRDWRRKDEIISIFVDNIESRTTTEVLRTQFEKFGEVCDVFISKKRRVNNPKSFGFVKIKGPRNAHRAIEEMRGRWIDNSRIFVKEARFKEQVSKNGFRKGKGQSYNRENWVPRNKEMHRRPSPTPSKDKLKSVAEESFVKVKVNPTILEELERSLIGESDEPRAVEVLSQTLTNQWSSITKVRDLGPYKFIVTFTEKVDMEHAINTKNSPLMQYFSYICPWDIYQQGDTRRIWVEVMGIPPQVWSRDTCDKIAQKFGTLVCCDSGSENPNSFVTCRMMIDTNIMSYIAEVVYLSIDEQCIGKTIFVREGSNLTTCYIKQPEPNLNFSSNQWDDTISSNNHGQTGVHEPEGDKLSGTLAIVAETPRDKEQSKESERTVTLSGNVNYDINEEMELLSMRRGLSTQLENPTSPMIFDDDCPPGFQKILNAKKFKRNSKCLSKEFKQRNTNASKNKSKKKANDQLCRDEITRAELNSEDNIEPWSEDDFENDRNEEELKAKELGRLLGFRVGESLDIDQLLM